MLRRQKRAAPRAALESPRRRASSRPAARDDPGGFSGRWVNDRQRSDHMGDQLLGIGIPWVIRETLLRSSNVKLISRDGLDWTEESVTTLVSKVQRLRLDGVQQEAGQDKRAKFPTSKPHISAVFHSFRLIFGRAIISPNTLEAWMLFPERARAEHSR